MSRNSGTTRLGVFHGFVYLAEEVATQASVKLILTSQHQAQRGVTYRIDLD
jgi:hypothetical protein